MIFPCPQHIACPGAGTGAASLDFDSPIANLTSERDDGPTYLSDYYDNWDWPTVNDPTNPDNTGDGTGDTQDNADVDAANRRGEGSGDSTGRYGNNATTCELACPSGGSVRATVPFATFITTDATQLPAIAAQAEALACEWARRLCNSATGAKDGTDTVLDGNQEQSCSEFCPDGQLFTATVPAGTFKGNTTRMDIMNSQAYALACRLANEHRICLISSLTPAEMNLCVGQSYNQQIGADTVGDVTFSLPVGPLPDGLVWAQINSNQMVISGTATKGGNFTFTVRGANAAGFVQNTYTIKVVELTSPTALPDFTIGTPYSYQLTATGGTADWIWSLEDGFLPSGLSLSLDGLLSGTPTADNGTTDLTIGFAEPPVPTVMMKPAKVTADSRSFVFEAGELIDGRDYTLTFQLQSGYTVTLGFQA
jgi:hypothetical protein